MAADGIILELDGLSVGYTDEPVVVDFSTAIRVGSVTTVIGPNGAGKSTLLRAVYGLTRHFAGSVRFFGQAIERLPPRERLKLGIGFVPQGRCNFPLMTVRENLELGAYTLRGPAVAAAVRVSEGRGSTTSATGSPWSISPGIAVVILTWFL